MKKPDTEGQTQNPQSSHSVMSKIFGQSSNRMVKGVAITLLTVFVFSLGVTAGNGSWYVAQDKGETGLPERLDYSSINKVYRELRSNYDGKLTEAQILDGMKKGIAEATNDPYTEYFNAKDAAALNQQIDGSFSGIGAQLGQDDDKNLEVIAPIDGTPAAKAGLKAHDIIATIDGTSTSGMSVDAAVTKIRGKKGTTVKLQVIRAKTEALNFAIVRDDITIPSVKSSITDDNIGYMEISQFTSNTGELAQKAAEDFKSHNVKGIVLDLRDNPGGLVDAAVKVSSLWLPGGKSILQEKRGSVVVDGYTSDGTNTLDGIPTAVLINEGSASASEITAGALHDNKVAKLIGAKSYGKGVVQQIIDLGGNTELKVTVASWYRPNGQNINKKGITPDQIVKLSDADAKSGNDTQKTAAFDYIKAQ